MGGMVPCIQNGLIQKEIAAEAYRHQQRIENGEQVVVGVNKFARDEPERRQLELWELDPALGVRQREELARIKARRDNFLVASTLNNLRDAARSDRSLMPAIIDAVRAYASIGEICGVLREEFGIFQEPASI
jgi:methylmalonyl-CoA mutase N-terminal domain/subunit